LVTKGTGPSSSRGFSRALHSHFAGLIDNADAKAAAVASLDLALGAVLVAAPPYCHEVSAVFGWIGLGFAALSLVACLWAVVPRLPSDGDSLVFFEHVQQRTSADAFAREALALSSEWAEREWARNNFHLAQVLHRKFASMRVAMVCAALLVVCAAVATAAH
jgi:hypothetical protein